MGISSCQKYCYSWRNNSFEILTKSKWHHCHRRTLSPKTVCISHHVSFAFTIYFVVYLVWHLPSLSSCGIWMSVPLHIP